MRRSTRVHESGARENGAACPDCRERPAIENAALQMHPWHRPATSLKPKYEGTKRRAIEEHRQREEEPHRAQEQARHFWTHNEGG